MSQRMTSVARLTPRSRDSGSIEMGQASGDGVSTPLFIALLVVIVVEYVGLASYIPLLKAIRLTTILSYLVCLWALWRVGVVSLLAWPQTRTIIALIALSALSMLWAVVTTHAFLATRSLIDYLILTLAVSALVDRKSRIDLLSWAMALVCIFLVAVNVEHLASGVRAGQFRAGYFMGDGNDFAWGMVFALPLILNLVLGTRALFTRIVGLVGIACCLIGIIGSSSRGATLGLVASITFYWLALSQRKILGVVAIICVAAGVLIFAPPAYFERMHSVAEYQSDNSAKARLQAWGAAVRMARDHPLGVGAGNFSSAYGRFYRPDSGHNALSWAPERWISAHSIYFKTLGEYGILGLTMLLYLLWLNLRDNLRSRQTLLAAGVTARISPTWPGLLTMSLIGFAVCGTFLGGLSYPHLFLLTGLTIAATRLAVASAAGSQSSGNNPRPVRPRPAGARRPTLK
jgi:probable O-glycosylation ligase (exosortase A-associated)